MKIKFLTFLIATIAASNFVFSQSKPLTKKQLSETEHISAEQIMLVFKGNKININDIKLSNVVSLFGKAKQIKKQKSEIDDQIYTTYIYESGEIGFDQKGRVYDWEINKPGWECIFKVNGKTTQPFTLSSNLVDLKSTFTHSWAANKRTGILVIYLITSQKTPVDAAIVFGIKNNHITFISLSENDS